MNELGLSSIRGCYGDIEVLISYIYLCEGGDVILIGLDDGVGFYSGDIGFIVIGGIFGI